MRNRRRPTFRSHLRLLLVTIAASAATMTCAALPAAQASTPPANCPYGRICSLRPGQAVPGCSSGYVCVYNGSTFGSGVELRYYNYGAYNLHSQYHSHLIVNNQHYDSHYHEAAEADLCTGYNGTKQFWDSVDEGDYQVENLTPINSIVLKAAAYPLYVPTCTE
ncbi:MAG: hypothetical protein ACR2NR_06570 [Solirubrobacteraceae bacterium]